MYDNHIKRVASSSIDEAQYDVLLAPGTAVAREPLPNYPSINTCLL